MMVRKVSVVVVALVLLGAAPASGALKYRYVGEIKDAATSPTSSYAHFGVATDAQGRIYVTDFSVAPTLKAQIKVYSAYPELKLIRTFGDYGITAGKLAFPFAVTVDPAGRVYVVDFGRQRLLVFSSYDSGNAFLSEFSASGGLPILGAFGATTDSNGNVYTTEIYGNSVRVFSSYPGNAQLGTVGSSGSGSGSYNFPMGVALDAQQNIYVTDYINKRVNIYGPFSAGAGFISSFGGAGTGNGQFLGPAGVALDASGRAHVVDSTSNRVQAFSSRATGSTFITSLGSKGSGSGQFNAPWAVATYSNLVYVADVKNGRIEVLSFGEAPSQSTDLSLMIKERGSGGSGESKIRVCFQCQVTIHGKLKEQDGGDAIGGATLEVQAKSLAVGSSWQVIRTVETDGDGEYSLNYTAPQSRRVRVSYEGDADHDASSATGRVSVEDTSSFRVRKKGGKLIFSGKIRSASYQSTNKRRPGKMVALAFKSADSDWRTFSLLRASSKNGRFRLAYKPRRTGTLFFSAQVVHDFDDAFADGRSRVLQVSL